MIPSTGIASVRGEESAFFVTLESDAEIVSCRVDGSTHVSDDPLSNAVERGFEQVQSAHAGMAVGNEINRHRIAHVGKQLVPLGIDGGAEVFHSAEAVFSGDSRAKA